MNKEQIEKQAKDILEKFAKALEKVEKESKKSKEAEEFHVERDVFEREENQGEKCEGFKETMLANAPKKIMILSSLKKEGGNDNFKFIRKKFR